MTDITTHETNTTTGTVPDKQERTGSKYQKVINELKTQPGRWAFVGTFSKEQFTSVYHGLVRNGCEATTRVIPDAPHTRGVWARWPK